MINPTENILVFCGVYHVFMGDASTDKQAKGEEVIISLSSLMVMGRILNLQKWLKLHQVSPKSRKFGSFYAEICLAYIFVKK